MRKSFFITPKARYELSAILDHIWSDNPTASRAMRERFNEAFCKLGEYPHMGQQREELTRKPVRFWLVHPNYMIVYDAATNPVRVLRILHTARDLSVLLN